MVFSQAGFRYYLKATEGTQWAFLSHQIRTQIAPERPLVIMASSIHQSLRLFEQLKFFSKEQATVRYLPDLDGQIYSHLPSSGRNLAERMLMLLALLKSEKNVIWVTSLQAAMRRISPSAFIKTKTQSFHLGQTINRESLIGDWMKMGYRRVEKVQNEGELAIRGALIEIGLWGMPYYVRLDFMDDEICAMDAFELEAPHAKVALNAFESSLNSEFDFDLGQIQSLKKAYQARFQTSFTGHQGGSFESLLPLFWDKTETLLDYIQDDALIVHASPVSIELQYKKWMTQLDTQYQKNQQYSQVQLLEPKEIFVEPDAFFGELKRFGSVVLFEPNQRSSVQNYDRLEGLIKGSSSLDFLEKHKLLSLEELLEWTKKQGWRLLLVVKSLGRQFVLQDSLKENKIGTRNFSSFDLFIEDQTQRSSEVGLMTFNLTEGYCLSQKKCLVVTENELHRGKNEVRDSIFSLSANSPVNFIKQLKEGDWVIHQQHGIGLYQGLELLDDSSGGQEMIVIEYANQSRLLLPASQLHLLEPYVLMEGEQSPTLDQLGSKRWQKLYSRALKKAEDTAVKLLSAYAKRVLAKRAPIIIDSDEQKLFEDSFPYEETEDQLRSIRDIFLDFGKDRPMDRLLCGDVGLGKTEVAMRAAFAVVNSGAQVVCLAPTTLLVEQHYERFVERFSPFGLKIGLLSRMRNNKSNQNVLELAKSGALDIVIGTHKLLQANVQFKHLGFLIIDEEHRFGVKQKDYLKKNYPSVDVLMMTATPIPRTLYMATSDFLDLSIITQPPKDRLPIKTLWFDEEIDDQLEAAIVQEVERGGQVYYLCNRLDKMDDLLSYWRKRLPEVRFSFAHGQMKPEKLEENMLNFYHRQYDVLICSTIIETGIDIPNVNTMIVEQADRYGLLQLHQLRGRVGRSHQQAYCYMITSPRKLLSKTAYQRLHTIMACENLGSGFQVALSDMDIRGAGEIFGEGQSGHLQEISHGTYMKMVEKAIKQLGQTDEKQIANLIEVESEAPAFIPEHYIHNINERLGYYQRMSCVQVHQEIDNLQADMINQFGYLSDETKHWFDINRLKMNLKTYPIKRVLLEEKHLTLIFEEAQLKNEQVDRLIALLQNPSLIDPSMAFQLNKNKLQIETSKVQSPEDQFEVINRLTHYLGFV